MTAGGGSGNRGGRGVGEGRGLQRLSEAIFPESCSIFSLQIENKQEGLRQMEGKRSSAGGNFQPAEISRLFSVIAV